MLWHPAGSRRIQCRSDRACDADSTPWADLRWSAVGHSAKLLLRSAATTAAPNSQAAPPTACVACGSVTTSRRQGPSRTNGRHAATSQPVPFRGVPVFVSADHRVLGLPTTCRMCGSESAPHISVPLCSAPPSRSLARSDESEAPLTCLPRAPAVVVAVMVASTVSASPFHYDELVSGDLNYAGVFELGVGVNTITGMTGSPAGDRFGDSDVFTFEVPVGTNMTAILFAFSTSGTAATLATAVNIIEQIAPDRPSCGLSECGPPWAQPDRVPSRHSASFQRGLYLFDLATPLQKFPLESEVTTSYRLDLTVDAVAVPEPTSSLLLAVGLAGVGARGAGGSGSGRRQAEHVLNAGAFSVSGHSEAQARLDRLAALRREADSG